MHLQHIGKDLNPIEHNTYGGYIMAFVITDECLSCGACAAQCPAEAISMGELHYEIDPDKCLECGACAAQCPAEAIEG